MFSYNQFKASIKSQGLARQNRFYIELTPPASMAGSPLANSLRFVLMRCKSVSMPGVSVSTTSERIVGEAVEKPYDRTFSPATMTFYMDQNFLAREFFETWVNTIQSSDTRHVGWYDDIVSREINIKILDLNDNVKHEVVLYDAMPKSLGAFNLDNSDNGVMTFDVTFDYHYYKNKYAESIVD